MSTFENRRWLVIPTSITDTINFNEIHQSNVDSLRLSIDGTQTFVKYEINEILEDEVHESIEPESGNVVTNVITAGIYGRPSFYNSDYSEFNHTDILELLSTEDWTSPNVI